MDAEQIIGGILGVVVGDALGLPVQFETRDEIKRHRVTDMRGWGTFNLPPGSWSDDSSLTLCLTESLCAVGYNPEDIAERFISWYENGYWTPFDRSFDIGGTTATAMERLIDGVPPLKAGPSGETSNGNGSLMRIIPAALYFAPLPEQEMLAKVCEVSKITHGHPRSQLACWLYALLVKELLNGNNPHHSYESLIKKADTAFANTPLAKELSHYHRIISGTLPGLSEGKIRSSGYVVDSLEAAIWSFLNNSTFEGTLLAAVNLGEDTDTIGAISGGLAGIYYGVDQIPDSWLNKLIRLPDIKVLAARLAHTISVD